MAETAAAGDSRSGGPELVPRLVPKLGRSAAAAPSIVVGECRAHVPDMKFSNYSTQSLLMWMDDPASAYE